jgi:hypothetical protein
MLSALNVNGDVTRLRQCLIFWVIGNSFKKVTRKPKSVPLQIIHFHILKQHDVSILLPFFTTHYVYRRYRVKTMLPCLRQCLVFVRKTWENWGIPRTTDVSGAVFNALLLHVLATHCF